LIPHCNSLGHYGLERLLHTRALVIRIEESDYHSAAQSLERNQVFGREFLAVFGEEMSLDVVRASPFETTEPAVSRWLVYVPPVARELLGTPKGFVAIGTLTDSPPLLTAHYVATAAAGAVAALLVGVLDSYMPPESESDSVGMRLGYVSSEHKKPGGGAHVVGSQLGLRPHWRLSASGSCFRVKIPCWDTE